MPVIEPRTGPADEVGTHPEVAILSPLFQKSPLPMWVFHRETLRFLEANEAVEAAYGWSREELLGMRATEIRPAEDIPRFLAAVAGLGQDQMHSGHWRHRRRDGSVFEAAVSAHAVDHEGQPACFVVVTEAAARTPDEDLRTIRSTFAQILDCTPGGVVHVARDGSILHANPAAQRLLGLAWDEFRQRMVADFAPRTIREDGSPFPVEDYPVARCLATGEAQPPATIGVYRPDGGLTWAVFTAFPLRGAPDGPADGAVVTFLDITERKRMEAALLQAQKLEGLGLLAGGVAHDFNNLLLAVMGNLELARHALNPLEPRTARYFERMGHALERASELCHQMLACSGKGSFVVQPLDLGLLAQEMSEVLRASLPKGVALTVEAEPDLPRVVGDPLQVRQALVNLVLNAGEAIGAAAGSVAIRVRARPCAGRELEVPYQAEPLPPGTYVELEVRDDGCGMDRDVQGRIFDPFFTTKFTGRGLGLAALLGILRAHRGAVRVESAPGRGSAFRLLMPATDPAPAAPPPAEPAAQAGPLRGRVLLVDDEPEVLEAVASLMETLGLEVETARDGIEALARLDASADGFALVLMDLTMPRLDGLSAAREVRRRRPFLPVLLSSGYAEDAALPGLGELRLQGFLRKPYGREELVQALARALRGTSG